jgi:hypothetical protein
MSGCVDDLQRSECAAVNKEVHFSSLFDSRPCVKPCLDDLFQEPIVRLLMARDGVKVTDVLDALRLARRNCIAPPVMRFRKTAAGFTAGSLPELPRTVFGNSPQLRLMP